MLEKEIYTYQDLAQRYNRTVRTVRGWFASRAGILRIAENSVLVPRSVVKKFEKEKATKDAKTKGKK